SSKKKQIYEKIIYHHILINAFTQSPQNPIIPIPTSPINHHLKTTLTLPPLLNLPNLSLSPIIIHKFFSLPS
ncbi:hypothetical protein, partial [Staphylococcus pettenkoferi]|uniref:hypothetical protein n=1 Tax=Staphylococcus pettenkoferi TaxID=170573 RepID=UPI001C930455